MKYLSNRDGAFIWREGNTDNDKWIRPISPVPTSLQNHGLATAAPYEHNGCMLMEFQTGVSNIKLPGTFSGSTPRLALGRRRFDDSPASALTARRWDYLSSPRVLLTSASEARPQ